MRIETFLIKMVKTFHAWYTKDMFDYMLRLQDAYCEGKVSTKKLVVHIVLALLHILACIILVLNIVYWIAVVMVFLSVHVSPLIGIFVYVIILPLVLVYLLVR